MLNYFSCLLTTCDHIDITLEIMEQKYSYFLWYSRHAHCAGGLASYFMYICPSLQLDITCSMLKGPVMAFEITSCIRNC
jgi:hypothetical protein